VPAFAGFPLGVTSGTYDHTFSLLDPTFYNPAFPPFVRLRLRGDGRRHRENTLISPTELYQHLKQVLAGRKWEGLEGNLSSIAEVFLEAPISSKACIRCPRRSNPYGDMLPGWRTGVRIESRLRWEPAGTSCWIVV